MSGGPFCFHEAVSAPTARFTDGVGPSRKLARSGQLPGLATAIPARHPCRVSRALRAGFTTQTQREVQMATEVGIRELLEAGVHFGHQTRRWHPKMRRYIFGERDGIYIIDLLQTVDFLERARAFVEDLASRGGMILFVGTKKQAKDTIKEGAEEAGMLHVNERWLGGLLTNSHTMRTRIARLHELRELS